jgi:mycofactocin precursor
MDTLAAAPAPPAPADADIAVLEEDGLIEEDLLVEDISIDGMCGVY